MIHARGLTRTFRTRSGRAGHVIEAVRGVDIDIAPVELVGFLGPNGAGKTTTLRMLTTLLTPTAGTATVAGADLLREPVEVRRRIGYVGQGGGSSPDVPVLEELVVHGRLYGLSAAEARRRAGALLGQFDLGDTGGRPVGTLSGGQKRRLDIAMGLIHTPRLVFLDEPSTGLDPQGRANLWQHVRGLRDEHGVTVFLTTHYLDEADALCDRVLVIDGGRIIAEGTPEELKRRISGDQVTLTVEPAETATAARLAAAVPQATGLVADAGTIRMRVPRGATAMPVLLRSWTTRGSPRSPWRCTARPWTTCSSP